MTTPIPQPPRTRAERIKIQSDLAEAVVRGKPGSERVRHLFMIQHYRTACGKLALIASMVRSERAPAPPAPPDGVEAPPGVTPGFYSGTGPAWNGVDAIAYRAFMREVGGIDPGPTDPSEFSDTTSVVAVRDGRIVGWLCGRPMDAAVMLATTTPDGLDASRCAFLPPGKADVPTIEMAWVAAHYRGRGIAAEMVRSLASRWELSLNRIAFALPFSDDGLHLVRATAGPRFIAMTGGITMWHVPESERSGLVAPDAVIDLPAISPGMVSAMEIQGKRYFREGWDAPHYRRPPETTGRQRGTRRQLLPRGQRHGGPAHA